MCLGAKLEPDALTEAEQFIIAAAGSFDLILDDGKQSRTIGLNPSWKGVYIPTMVWRELVDFSSGAVCLSLVSTHYDDGGVHPGLCGGSSRRWERGRDESPVQ